jgi:hypothetical protein
LTKSELEKLASEPGRKAREPGNVKAGKPTKEGLKAKGIDDESVFGEDKKPLSVRTV